MKLTEQIHLKPAKSLSKLCHLAKNLYNLANFYIGQEYFCLGNWLRYIDIDYILKYKVPYRRLPSQTSQQILRLLDKNWKSYFKTIKDYYTHPKKYYGRPQPPRYKSKNGESVAIFTNQQCKIKGGKLYFPKKANLNPVKTRIRYELNQVRVIPKGAGYVIEIIYEKEIKDLNLNKKNIIGIPIGYKLKTIPSQMLI